jgi:ribonuclease HI
MAITCYFDGGCKNGKMTASYVIENVEGIGSGTATESETSDEGDGTNNIAEWSALLNLVYRLEALCIMNRDIEIYGDSQIVVYGITGKYKVKAPHLISIAKEVDGYLNILKMRKNNISIEWKKREFNKADKESYSEGFKPSWK